MADEIIAYVADTLRREQTLEGAVRGFLKIIELSTGLESAYLTHVDTHRNVQTVMFARNTSDLRIPEGLAVAWGDTLCKRALDEGCPFTSDVATRWGDSEAARALGIQTYLSTPVHVDHALYGTLCGASAQQRIIEPRNQQLLSLFGEIISMYLAREGILDRLHDANVQLEQLLRLDPLTGISNRRHLIREMERLWSFAAREERTVIVTFIDLDDFKRINDRHGHAVGDEFLVAVGRKLAGAVREADLLARIGGDEFVVVGLAPPDAGALAEAKEGVRSRLDQCLKGTFNLPSLSLDYGGASVGVIDVRPEKVSPEQAVKLADEAMYVAKNRKRLHAT